MGNYAPHEMVPPLNDKIIYKLDSTVSSAPLYNYLKISICPSCELFSSTNIHTSYLTEEVSRCPMKTCQHCGHSCAIRHRICPQCKEEFPLSVAQVILYPLCRRRYVCTYT